MYSGWKFMSEDAERVLFCWNSLPRDAWFQDWPGK